MFFVSIIQVKIATMLTNFCMHLFPEVHHPVLSLCFVCIELIQLVHFERQLGGGALYGSGTIFPDTHTLLFTL